MCLCRVSPSPRLTYAKVRALRPREIDYEVRDGLARGLALDDHAERPEAVDAPLSHKGKQRRLILGDFPALTLSRARDAADVASIEIRAGRDPVAERQAAAAKRTDTVNALAAEYLEKHARPKKRSAAHDERI